MTMSLFLQVELKIDEVDKKNKSKKKEHDRIVGDGDNDTHDCRTETESKIHECLIGSHGSAISRTRIIKGVCHGHRRQKSAPYPPEHSYEDKRRKGS